MKRVLVVNSNSLNADNATGITLRSFFSQIDTDCIMELYWNTTAEVSDQLDVRSQKLKFRFLSAGAFLNTDRVKQTSSAVRKMAVTPLPNERKSRVVKAVTVIRQWLALRMDMSAVHINQDVLKRIQEFSPQVIYTLGGGVSALRTAYALSRRLELPIVIHFMDNWRHGIQWDDNPLLKRYKRVLRKYCDKCYRRSTACIAVSPKMAEEYTRETGVYHSTLMNAIQVSEYMMEPRKPDGVLHFVYAGGLHLGRDEMLRTLGELIAKVSSDTGKKADLVIYTSEENIAMYSGRFEALDVVHFRSAVAHDQIKTVYQQADILVHAENTAWIRNTFFRYSVSTKIPEYLATGRPVLFFGPADTYLYDFLKQNGIAYAVSTRKEAEEALHKLLCGAGEELKEAQRYAMEHFDVSAAVRSLCETIDRVELP